MVEGGIGYNEDFVIREFVVNGSDFMGFKCLILKIWRNKNGWWCFVARFVCKALFRVAQVGQKRRKPTPDIRNHDFRVNYLPGSEICLKVALALAWGEFLCRLSKLCYTEAVPAV